MRAVLLGVTVALAAATAGGQDDGGLPAAFALMGGDGRTLALGGAGVVLEGVPAAYYNPAALATVEGDAITSTYRALSFDRRIVEVGYGRPIVGDAGLAITWTHASVADLQGRNYAGNPTEKITNSQNVFVFGFGRPVFGEWLQAGAGGRFYYSAIAEGRATGFGADVGFRLTPRPWFTAAAAVRDVATKLRWSHTAGENYEEEVPLRLLAGAGLRPWKGLLVAAQGDVGRDEEWRYRLGLEYWIDDRVAVRCGVDDGAPTLGAAVRVPRGGYTVGFDYAFVEEEFTAEAAHTVTLALTF
ncbi:MAG: hypothetical protein JSU81_02355 [Candidatus Coatesbacteria bacterium]|nr:MAG: hypothetical protein JSU81_02355 [Candidatus Coatesbacteria bacterium]